MDGGGPSLAGRPQPILLRISRLLAVLSLVATLGLAAYVGLAIYSAREVSTLNPGASRSVILPRNEVEITAGFNLSNLGPFPIDGMTLEGVLELPNSTQPVTARSAPQELPGGSERTLNLTFVLSTAPGSPGAYLLTRNATLPITMWANASYAHLVVVDYASTVTFDWRAPLADLSLAVGTGPGSDDWRLAFYDAAGYGLTGTLSLDFLDGAGESCGWSGDSFDVGMGAGGAIEGPLPSLAGCDLTGGTYEVVWTTSSFSALVGEGSLG